jgi:hypothetical protein
MSKSDLLTLPSSLASSATWAQLYGRFRCCSHADTESVIVIRQSTAIAFAHPIVQPDRLRTDLRLLRR